MSNRDSWQPLADQKLDEIRQRFATIFPEQEYGDLAQHAGDYWIAMLEKGWREKEPESKKRELSYLPADPLSRTAPCETPR